MAELPLPLQQPAIVPTWWIHVPPAIILTTENVEQTTKDLTTIVYRNKRKLLPMIIVVTVWSLFLRIHTLSHQASGYICKGHLCFHILSYFSCQFVCCISDVVVIWSTCVTYYNSVQLGEFKGRLKFGINFFSIYSKVSGDNSI